jgi:hypothetical protein
MVERGGGRRGAKSYEGEKAWSSINHSILSGAEYTSYHHLVSDEQLYSTSGDLGV